MFLRRIADQSCSGKGDLWRVFPPPDRHRRGRTTLRQQWLSILDNVVPVSTDENAVANHLGFQVPKAVFYDATMSHDAAGLRDGHEAIKKKAVELVITVQSRADDGLRPEGIRSSRERSEIRRLWQA